MTTLLICVFIATLLPIVAKAPLVSAMAKLEGGYDNRHPRSQQANLEGFGARAKAAHENSFEALIMFTPGALACIAVGKLGYWVEATAIVFVCARVAYLFSYWYDVHIARSSFWSVGFVSSLALIVLAIV